MKKVIYILLTIITFSCITTNAIAVTTRGSPLCSEWVQNQKEKEIKGNTIAALDNESWLLGFLSGYALYSDINFIEGTDNKSLFLWVSNYCSANPLKALGTSGDALFKELKKEKGL